MDEKQEARKREKERRLLEKAMRMPINDVILEVRKGTISLKSLFEKIDARLGEVSKNG